MFKIKIKRRSNAIIIELGLVFNILDSKKEIILFKIANRYKDGNIEYIDLDGKRWTKFHLEAQIKKGNYTIIRYDKYLAK